MKHGLAYRIDRMAGGLGGGTEGDVSLLVEIAHMIISTLDMDELLHQIAGCGCLPPHRFLAGSASGRSKPFNGLSSVR